MTYIPHTAADRQVMLDVLGLSSPDDLFAEIPQSLRFAGSMGLPPPLSEAEVGRRLRELAGRNRTVEDRPCFLGAGAYRHFIPAVVGAIASRGEFFTAYTPYQAEVSQGTLQVIYEFQSLIARLTGMEVANASLYDGSTALAEAALVAHNHTGRSRLLVSEALHPEYREVLNTYLGGGRGVVLEGIPTKAGTTDPAQVKSRLGPDVAALIIQNPNVYGLVEDGPALASTIQGSGAAFIVAVLEPVSLGVLKRPGEYGADLVAGEGQSLGSPLGFGGPGLGLLGTRKAFLRKIPGRLVGRTTDAAGRRGFVMTLQAREQHIRREKALSNICSNEALLALAAAVHLSALGPRGLRQVAETCAARARYLRKRILALPGCSPSFGEGFFNEVAVELPLAADEVNARLLDRGIVGGYPLCRVEPDRLRSMLFCATELTTPADIDALVAALEELS